MIEKLLDKLADKIVERLNRTVKAHYEGLNLGEVVANKVKRELMKEMAWEVFSTLGLDYLEKVLKKSKKGRYSYSDLAEAYADYIKTLGYENIKRWKSLYDKQTPSPKE